MLNMARRIVALRHRKPREVAREALRFGFGENLLSAHSARVIRAHDRRKPAQPGASDPALHALFRDGFVNLGPLGIDVESLAEHADAVFARVGQAPELTSISIRHPFLFHSALVEILYHQRVNRLVQGYLGDDATFDLIELFRIPSSTSTPRVSGLWHHDRVGHRLLLWVLLHDLDESGRATWYATGSHRRVLARNSFAASRLPAEFVEAHYRDRRQMTGRKGDAILMDTHGLHRAVYEPGAPRRDIVMMGYSSFAKSTALISPLNLPIGVHSTWFPRGLDPSGTLLQRECLRRGLEHDEYVGGPGRDVPGKSSKFVCYLDHDVALRRPVSGV